MKKILLFGILAIVSGQVLSQSQRSCATNEKYLEAVKKDPSLLNRRAELESRVEQWIRSNSGKQATAKTHAVINIPVVIHVLHEAGTPAQNISIAQIQTQLDVINKDFRRLNSDTNKTPTVFKELAADCEINFCLALQDELGNPTTGITRRQTTVNEIGNTTNYYKTANGGTDNWDPALYLNIWVCEIDASGNTFGFAYLPGTAPSGADGLVIDYRFFGTITTVSPPFHLGRTVTHEIGHWLNLEHIWGDANCGNDFVADTPTQQDATSGCPTFPQVSCGNGPNGNMFQNYMDYSDDNCMNIFTLGQKDRMWAAINTSRSSLLSSMGCDSPLTVAERIKPFTFELFPNPGNGVFIIKTHSSSGPVLEISVYDLAGKKVFSRMQNLNGHEIPIDLSELRNGSYLVEIRNKSGTSTRKLIIIR